MGQIEFKLDIEMEEKIRNMIAEIIFDEVHQFKSKYGFDKTYLRKNELAQYLHISYNTINKWIQAGLPQIEVAGVKLYCRESIDEWLKNH
jgi:DNA-binding transcriptional regulator YiaG